jgi:hypothetical protein
MNLHMVKLSRLGQVRVFREVIMSQIAVERLLGRLITDNRFRRQAANSLEVACLREGYSLSPAELQLLSALEMQCFTELAGRLDPNLCRVGGLRLRK